MRLTREFIFRNLFLDFCLIEIVKINRDTGCLVRD